MNNANGRVPAGAGTPGGLKGVLKKYSLSPLSCILIFGLALRITALFSLKETVYFDSLLYDEMVYHIWAEKIASGTFSSSSVYEFAPLFAYFMALVYKVFSPEIIYIRIANILFGVCACYLVYLIGKEIGNRRTGLYACLIACLYKPFIFYSTVPLKASLSVLLFASVVYLTIAIISRGSITKTVLSGISIGLLLNVRPQCIVIIPFLPLMLFWNNLKRSVSLKTHIISVGIFVAGFSIAVSPFLIRNYLVAGEVALTTSQSGFNLYQSNKVDRPGPVGFAVTSPFAQGIQFTIEASRRVGKKLSSREASSYWKKETLKIVMEHPWRLLKKSLRKTVVFFQKFQLTDHYCIGFMSGFMPFFKIPFPGFGLIMPFGMAGMAVCFLANRKVKVMTLIFFLYASTHILFFTVTRYRLPLLVILIPLAVAGIERLVHYIKEKQLKRTCLYVVFVAVFFIIGLLPVRRTDDYTAYYNGHAILLNRKGFGDEAKRYWEKSSEMKGLYSDFANLSLARKYLLEKGLEKAAVYLGKISDESFAAAQKYDLTGDMMMLKKRIGSAVSCYEKSLEINSGQTGPRKKLVRIFSRIDKQRAKKEYEKLKYISSFYDGI